MRIAIWHNLPSGGGKRALYYHVRGLVERGHTVESWCPSTADQSYLPLSALVREHVLPVDFAEPRWLRFAPYNVAVGYRLRTKLSAMDAHCRQCAGEMSSGGFDVILAGACRFFRTSPIARYLNLPSVIYLQEPFRWLYEALPSLPWAAIPEPSGLLEWPSYVKRFATDLVRVQALRTQMRDELTNARAFSLILVNSYYSRESVLRAYGLDATVCYLGIDSSLFIDRQRPRTRTVVAVGALTPEKNVKFIVEAMARLEAPRPHLVWIANAAQSAYLEEVQALAASLDVPLDVRVNVSDEHLVEILSAASVMVYAPRLEPFGFAPLEANACGLPVVAVAEGGVRETIIDGVNGVLTNGDVGEFAGAVGRLLADPHRAAQLGQKGRQLVADRWSLAPSIDRLERNLTRVAAASK